MTDTTPRAQNRERADAAGDRSAADIEADIVATRSRLAGTIDEITERVHPKTIAARVQAAAKAQVIDPETGAVRVERVAAAVGVVVLIVGVRVWRARH